MSKVEPLCVVMNGGNQSHFVAPLVKDRQVVYLVRSGKSLAKIGE